MLQDRKQLTLLGTTNRAETQIMVGDSTLVIVFCRVRPSPLVAVPGKREPRQLQEAPDRLSVEISAGCWAVTTRNVWQQKQTFLQCKLRPETIL
jgi:hypothetical protein